MKSQINDVLSRMFQKHRIIFWYDDEKSLRKDFESVELDNVERVEVQNNEFMLKYRMLREQPEQQFLVYHEGPQPEDLQNWLLDVLLAHDQVRVNQVSLWMHEVGLPFDFSDVVDQHSEFFKAAKRRQSLQKLISADETKTRLRQKLMAVCVGAEAKLEAILEALLSELADGRDDKYKLLEKCDLTATLWEQARRVYGYRSESVGVLDFVIELFKSCFAMGLSESARLNSEALVFLKRWKDSRTHEDAFEKLSDRCADILGVQHQLQSMELKAVAEIDYFRLVDQKILSDLVRLVGERMITAGEGTKLIRQRRIGHWYRNFKHEYEAVELAGRLIELISDVCNLQMQSPEEGFSRYTESWYQVDLLYRQFCFNLRRSTHNSLLQPLAEKVEQLYSNKFLLPLGDRWQAVIDQQESWSTGGLLPQRAFYEQYVLPFLSQGKKVCVIISDGMRYEIAHELASLIRQEDRYSAEVKAVVTGLPSYTQLGMAALLPNKELKIGDVSRGDVLVDGKPSAGLENRRKILTLAVAAEEKNWKADAKSASDVLEMHKDAVRELFRDNNVIYIYQDIIDSTAHSTKSEDRAFEAVQEAMEELVRLVKKLTAANASNLLITSDHGFIFQNGVQESDFVSPEANEAESAYRDRRFLLGTNLAKRDGLKHYRAEQVGLAGLADMLIPKSINRLRLSGSCFRYVHGGASLQEVVVPVISINKSRQSDVAQVEVDLIRGSVSTISTGQLAIQLYQLQPVDEKLKARTIRVGIYAQNDELISDEQEIPFDLTSENPRDREMKTQLVLSGAADAYNNQQVILKLMCRVQNTAHYQEYKSQQYTLRRSFTSDFDFE
jgi:uncharacterized protein (TIGR02687 family)